MDVDKDHMFNDDPFLKCYLDRVLKITARFNIAAKYVRFVPSPLRPCGMALSNRATFNYLRIYYGAF